MSVTDLFNFDIQFKKTIIGTDEAGRGPAAGGVFAAAVCFEKINNNLIKDLSVLNDSKKLTPKKREAIFDTILKYTDNKIVCVEVEEIEKINILNSSLKAMNIACSAVIKDKENTLTLVDGNKLIKNYAYTQQYIIKGDSKSASIAAASILAKVSRDRYMLKLHEEYPMYNWAKNAGYLTKEHLEAFIVFRCSPFPWL
jgi:ribonuclease HII